MENILNSKADVQKEILGKLAPLLVKFAQDRLKGKTPDQDLLVCVATDLITTYGVGPVCEAFMALDAGMNTLIAKSNATPPPIPDGASELVN
jgi:hypothetical protein